MIVKKIKNPSKSSTKAARIGRLADYIREPGRDNGKEKCIYSGALGFLCDTPEGQKAEMIALASESVRSKDPISHYVLSWKEDELPTRAQVNEAVAIFLDELGLSGHQLIFGLHADSENRHIHIQVNRVHPDTLNVIKPNKGFDIEAAHRAVARIEHAQGWTKEPNARYDVVDERVVKRSEKAQREHQPTSEKQAREQWTGEQSAERIAITDATPVIRNAKTWQELHYGLAAIGMRYERKGSGALVFVGEVPIKASNVDRSASLGAMQKRLGPFEPSSQEKPNEYFSHQAKPYPRHLGQTAGHGMRDLSECRMAQLGVDQESAGVLLVDARSSRRSADGLRRNPDRRTNGSTGRAARPLTPNQPAWPEYLAARDAYKTQKQTEFDGLKKRHKDEWSQLLAGLKAERISALAGDWRGKGQERNALSSVIATRQAAEKLALREQQVAEREALQAQFRPLPPYREWKLAPAITGKIVIEDTIEIRAQIADQTKKLSTTLRQLECEQDLRGHMIYRSRGVEIFRDEGRRLAVLDPHSDEAIAVALAVAQQKFGRTLTLTGDPAFQKRVVAIAVAHGMNVVFADPDLEKLRFATKAERTRKRIEKPIGVADKWAKVRQELAPSNPPTAPAVDAALPEPAKTKAEAPAAPEKALEEKRTRPTVEEWLAARSELAERKPAPLPANGRVLYVADDGKWVQNLGQWVAVRLPVDKAVQVDDRVEIDRHGRISKLELGSGKGRAG